METPDTTPPAPDPHTRSASDAASPGPTGSPQAPRSMGPRLVAVLLVAAGLWAVLTLRFQSELWPLFPAGLRSVEGLKLAQSTLSTGRELILVMESSPSEAVDKDKDKAATDALALLTTKLGALPSVAAVEPMLTGSPFPGASPAQTGQTGQASQKGQMKPSLLVAWFLANLPEAEFQRLVGRLTPEAISKRAEEVLTEMSGAPEPDQLLMLQADPLKLEELVLATFPESTRHALEKLKADMLAKAIAAGPPGAGADSGAASAPAEAPEGDGGKQPQPHTPVPAPAQPHVHALQIRSAAPLQGFEASQKFVAQVRSVIAEVIPDKAGNSGNAGSSPLRVYLTGRPAFVAEISSQMRTDMQVMITLATVLVALVFYLFYRTLAPLGWILLFVAFSLLAGAIAARLVFGELNVLSMAFACIILGVGMDYCILVYHLHAMRLRTRESWATLRHAIWLSAVTTAASFGILYFSSFPGFQQLAVLIAAGLLTIAYFATTWLGEVLEGSRPGIPAWIDPVSAAAGDLLDRNKTAVRWTAILALAAALAGAPWWMHYGFFNPSLDKLEPSHSEALRAQRLLTSAGRHDPAETEGRILRGTWQQIRATLAGDIASLSAAASASASESPAQAKQLQQLMGVAVLLPSSFDIDRNAAALPEGDVAQTFTAAMDKAGFEPEFGSATREVLDILVRWKASRAGVSTATSPLSDPLEPIARIVRSISSTPGPQREPFVSEPEHLAIVPAAPQSAQSSPVSLSAAAVPVSWPLLKQELSAAALADFSRLSVFMLGAITALCWLAHRSWRMVAINLIALAASMGLLGCLLILFHNSLSLMSLLAVPLLIGLVIDYSLHFLLELHHSDGSIREAYRHLAVPVLLTGITTLIGFGAPIASNQPALQNFGFVMDLGISSAVITALVLVPVLYHAIIGTRTEHPHYSRALYCVSCFSFGSFLVRCIPLPVLRRVAGSCGWLYAALKARAVYNVTQNLVLLQSPAATRNSANHLKAQARQTYAQFGMALADYFALGVRSRAQSLATISRREGYEHLKAAHEAGRGAILVTGHIGLFELGGMLMQEFGFKTIVLTLPEPSSELTDWRAAYRARWGVETMILGDDHFVYVQLMKHLREGKFLAVLIDRPHGDITRTVPVSFPGGSVAFSTGPAMLAALTGCPLIPTACVRLPDMSHSLQAWAPIPVPAAAARHPHLLEAATLQVANCLRPVILDHPTQWFQFVVPRPIPVHKSSASSVVSTTSAPGTTSAIKLKCDIPQPTT
ncbi:MAG: MMPL family transporter [Candidatus Methylacidiphilales bacterium]